MNKCGRKITDMVGKKFGKLTIIERAHDYVSPKGQHVPQWLCECECGNKVVVRKCLLERGKTSCGCEHKASGKNGVVGVSYSNTANKWIVSIYVGSFTNKDDANEACKKARNALGLMEA